MKLVREKAVFYLYVLFLLFIATSISLTSEAYAEDSSNRMLQLVTSTILYVGILGVVVSAVWINILRKRNKTEDKKKKISEWGIWCFCKCKEAKLADGVMGVSFLGVIITINNIETYQMAYWFLAIFIVSFGMHCMLNGVNYKYIKQRIGESKL